MQAYSYSLSLLLFVKLAILEIDFNSSLVSEAFLLLLFLDMLEEPLLDILTLLGSLQDFSPGLENLAFSTLAFIPIIFFLCKNFLTLSEDSSSAQSMNAKLLFLSYIFDFSVSFNDFLYKCHKNWGLGKIKTISLTISQ